MVDFTKMFESQKNAMEVDELCRRMGAGFVIYQARAYIDRKERQAAQEHAKWRAEMMAAHPPKG